MTRQGTFCKFDKPCQLIIDTATAWERLWADLGKLAPTVDFSKNFAVAAFAGTQNSGGYSIKFAEPLVEGDTLVIRYVVAKPKTMAIMALTQPYAIRLFPKTDRTVRVEGREE